METYRFSVVIEQNLRGFRAHCPEFEGCSVQCGTYDEAMEKIRESIIRRLEEKLRAGEEIPKPCPLCAFDFEIRYSLN